MKTRRYRYALLWFLLLCLPGIAGAHPMPNTIVALSVAGNRINGTAKVPLPELESALEAQGKSAEDTALLRVYFATHIKAYSGDDAWQTAVGHITYDRDGTMYYAGAKGNYTEAVVTFTLIPPAGRELRHFTFAYDAVIHQVLTHKIMVVLRQDWQNGIYEKEATDSTINEASVLGVIETDIASEKVFPLNISLKAGNNWKGFTAMTKLGMHHIAEGADHLLFLLVLLLTAPLLASGKRWQASANLMLSLKKILRITLAFTIGHSVTLILATLGWVNLPAQPVEVLIAGSILVTAVHAIRPLFPNREAMIAGGFGLVHGLAFATILTDFNLSGTPLVLSLLGFNIGIELMQLIVIIVTIPWLLILSSYSLYKPIRIGAAILAAIAALGWMTERISGRPNFISERIDELVPYGKYLILLLVLLTIAARLFTKKAGVSAVEKQ